LIWQLKHHPRTTPANVTIANFASCFFTLLIQQNIAQATEYPIQPTDCTLKKLQIMTQKAPQNSKLENLLPW